MKKGMKKVLIINGPNLNLLGTREKDVYGTETLEQIAQKTNAEALKHNINLSFIQTIMKGK